MLIIINFIFLSICLGSSIFIFLKFKKLNKELEKAKLHNETLQALYDDVSTFKHDFCNIIQTIDGYIKARRFAFFKKI